MPFRYPLPFLLAAILLVAANARGQGQASLAIESVELERFPYVSMNLRFIQQKLLVRNLTPEMLHLTENGVPQTITVDCPVLPAAVSIVLDKSLSMAHKANTNIYDPDSVKWRSAKAAVRNFAAQLQAPDVAQLISFNTEVSIDQGFTSNGDSIIHALENIEVDIRTAAWAACYEAILALSQRPERRVIILLTDGGDTWSQRGHGVSFDQIRNLAKERDVTVFTIGLADVSNQFYLTDLASHTGGTYYFSADGSDLTDIYFEITRSLSTPCRLQYLSSLRCLDGMRRDVSIVANVAGETAQADTFFIIPQQPDTVRFTVGTPAFLRADDDVVSIPLIARDRWFWESEFRFSGTLSYPVNAVEFIGAERSPLLDSATYTHDAQAGMIRVQCSAAMFPPAIDTLYTFRFRISPSSEVTIGRFSWAEGSAARECPVLTYLPQIPFLLDGLCDKIVRKKPGRVLGSPHPNPARSEVTIPIAIDSRNADAPLTIEVRDETGKTVAHLTEGTYPAGAYTFFWRPTETRNGVYWIQVRTAGGVETKPVMLLQ